MKLLKILSFIYILFTSILTYATEVSEFKVELSKDEAIAGQSLDLTVSALDEDGNIIDDYDGIILGYSDSDEDAEMNNDLASDDGYQFKPGDQGVKKFENAIKFFLDGKQDIIIYEAGDGIATGNTSINIIKQSAGPLYDIEITTPENGITIGNSGVNITGKTQKNHIVKITINGDKDYETRSDNDGHFEITIDDLENGENKIIAYIMRNDIEAGESDPINIIVDSTIPSFRKISLNGNIEEDGTVDEGENIIVTVLATKSLKSCELEIDDNIIELEEADDGEYVGNFNAPSEEKTYKIGIILKDNFGHKVEEKNAAEIKVKKILQAPDETGVIVPNQTTTTNPVIPSNKNGMDVTGLKVVKLKDRTVLSWDKIEKAEGYNIYKKLDTLNVVLIDTIPNIPIYEIPITGKVVKHELFAVKAFTKNTSGITYEGGLSAVTQVQTGPEILILILISLFGGGSYLYYRKRNKLN